MVRLVRVLKNEVLDFNLMLTVESNLNKMEKCIAFMGDGQVNYLENIYSNDYHLHWIDWIKGYLLKR